RRMEWGWQLLSRPRIDRFCAGADWVYCPVERAIPADNVRLAATCHSLYWFERDLPQYGSRDWRLTRLRLGSLMRKMVRRCDLLLTVSEFLKRQMVQWF